MLSHPPPDECAEAASLRGRVFTDLDLLAFALEMEAAAEHEVGDAVAAARAQERRLGVRLAQRMVAGVWADEVNGRMQRWSAEYQSRFPQTSA